MTISINSIGNYNPYTNKVGAASTTRKTASVIQPETKDLTLNNISKQNVISTKEKEFFAQLYPDNVSSIMDYHYYQRSGEMSGVSVGSLIDRRG